MEQNQLINANNVNPTAEEIEEGLKKIQDHISNFLVEATGQNYLEDKWDYEKGKGGGISRVWEGTFGKDALEKGGVNYSGIHGGSLPPSAVTQLKLTPDASGSLPFRAAGVSLVIHPSNPHCPTIHMNIRYFEAGTVESGNFVWWFGGGIDLTPYWPTEGLFERAKGFHTHLKTICERHALPYDVYKKTCDDYFFIKHRQEMRGIGGIFFDHLRTKDDLPLSKDAIWEFVKDVGTSFNMIYLPFIAPSRQSIPYDPSPAPESIREFQLIRRGRYVEFNLVYDRGTQFGLQSEGRTESILMSLPTIAKWRYNWKPKAGTEQEVLNDWYLQPRDWVNVTEEEYVSNYPVLVKKVEEKHTRDTIKWILLAAPVVLFVSLSLFKTRS